MQTELNRCPKCKAPLPANAPQGLCPKCLLACAAIPTEAGQSANNPAPSIETVASGFPQLEIIELIGQGGMGVVYKARQPKLDRFVALKLLPQALAADPAFAERFNREARVLARLNHPNIVTVYDFGQENGLFYLLMEFVDGVNLRQAMQAGRFTPAQALAIVPKVCEALQSAHNEGVLHRDIKPENILLDAKGRVKIADFGIAKLVGDAGTTKESNATLSYEPNDGNGRLESGALTEMGKTVGTPNYMAPEQLESPQEVDHRADIYSLGVVFYEMLTGELPRGRFAPPSQKSGAAPRVDEVVARALERQKEKRFASAEEVKTQVETIATTAQNGSSASGETDQQKGGEQGTSASDAGSGNIGGNEALSAYRTFPYRPWALVIVAVCLIVSGIFGAWDIGHGMRHHSYNFNFGALSLPVGIGLLRLRRWWRVTALATLTVVPAAILIVTRFMPGHFFRASAFGVEATGLARIAVIVVICALLIWSYRVLVRADVKALFQSRGFLHPWLEWVAFLAVIGVAYAKGPVSDPRLGQTTVGDVRLLRVTVRIIDFPGNVDTRLLHWPAALLDRKDVSVVATAHVTVVTGEEGEIHIPDLPDIGSSGAITGGKVKTLFVKPTFKNGSDWVSYALWGLLPDSKTGSASKFMMRSGTMKLGEFELMEEIGANGRKELAVITIEDEPQFADYTPAITEAVTNHGSFGPVVERTLNFAEAGTNYLLSFNTGELRTLPPEISGLGPEMQKWVRSEGVDLGVGVFTNTLCEFDMAAVPVPATCWDQLTPAEAVQRLNYPLVSLGIIVHGFGRLPATYAFETREGGVGILQVAEYLPAPATLKLRYKFLPAAPQAEARIAGPS